MSVLYGGSNLLSVITGSSGPELPDAVCEKSVELYDSVPDIEFQMPVIVIGAISDGCGNLAFSCWKLCGRTLSACFEPIDTFHKFYLDEAGNIFSSGFDIRNGVSFYLYRVFKEEIGHDEQQWLIDLINGAFEPDSGLTEEIERCTLPAGTAFMKKKPA